MDFAGGLGGGCPSGDGPGAAFVGAGGEEGDESEEVVAGADGAGHAAFGDAGCGAEFGGFFVGEFVEVHFEFSAHDGDVAAGAAIFFAVFGFELLASGEVFFADVEEEEEGFGGEELGAFEEVAVVFGELLGADGGFGFEAGLEALEEGFEAERAFAFAGLEGADFGFEALEAALDDGEVGEGELEVHGLDVAVGVDGCFGVRDGFVAKGADDVDEGIHAGEVVDEFAGGAFALSEGLASGGEVDVLDGGVGDFFGAVEAGEGIDALVGDGNDADVGLAGGGVGADLGSATGDGVEDGGFAGAGESDDAKLHGFRVGCDLARGKGVGGLRGRGGGGGATRA